MNDYLRLYYYSEDSPSGLVWAVDRFTGQHATVKVAAKGTPAGSKNKFHGYWFVSKGNGKYTRAHRVVWELHYGEIPNDMVIDHIDTNVDNNKISNLRLTTQKINSRNRRQFKNNSSGITGVKLNHKKYKDSIKSYWMAKWMDIHGVEKAKHFSIEKYGYDEAFRLACEYRAKMILELNAQGAGYTENHGKDSK